MLKGIGFEGLSPQRVWMLGLGTAIFATAFVMFRRRMM